MEYRNLGQSGLKVSAVGLGCMNFGMMNDAEESAGIVHKALELGINFFDTADVYGPEISEKRLGKFFKGSAEQPFIATKLGRFPDPGWPGNFTLEAMRAHTARK